MDPYLNIKLSDSPTLLSYNGTRHRLDLWDDPNTPTLLVMLVFALVFMVILCYCIKEKYCPNICWGSSHPTELANRRRVINNIPLTSIRVEPTPTIEQLTRKVDILTNVLIELVQDENGIHDETKTETSETILDNV